MNYLEELAAEYYAYRGYWVRPDVRIASPKGGLTAQLDVLAYLPATKTLVHIETDSAAESSANIEKKFREKRFRLGLADYKSVLKVEINEPLEFR